MHFVDCLEERNRRCLDNVEKLDQALTSSFCLLLEWVRVGLNDVTRSMLDLVDWLGVGQGKELLLLPISCILFFPLALVPLYTSCVLWCTF